jgi:hypothetical protein
MAIVVQHNPSLDVVGAAAQGAGYGQYLQQQQKIAVEQQQFAAQQQQRQQAMQVELYQDDMRRRQRAAELQYARQNEVADMKMQQDFRNKQNEMDFDQAKFLNEQRKDLELGLVEEKWDMQEQLKKKQLDQELRSLEQDPIFQNLSPEEQAFAKQAKINKAGIQGPMQMTPAQENMMKLRKALPNGVPKGMIVAFQPDGRVMLTPDPQVKMQQEQEKLRIAQEKAAQDMQAKEVMAQQKAKQEQVKLEAAQRKAQIENQSKVQQEIVKAATQEYNTLLQARATKELKGEDAGPEPDFDKIREGWQKRYEPLLKQMQPSEPAQPTETDIMLGNAMDARMPKYAVANEQQMAQPLTREQQAAEQWAAANSGGGQTNSTPQSQGGVPPLTAQEQAAIATEARQAQPGQVYTKTMPQYVEQRKPINEKIKAANSPFDAELIDDELASLQFEGERTGDPQRAQKWADALVADSARIDALVLKLQKSGLSAEEKREASQLMDKYKRLIKKPS